jgi:poly(A)-specific ribonuclease
MPPCRLPAGEKAPALRAALGLPADAPLPLPAISHAPGCSKYAAVEAGALAHEAGYDAFMTGAAFACLAQVYAERARLAGSSTAAVEVGVADLGVGEAAGTPSPALAHVAPHLGRFNVTRSDIPYAAFSGADPEPPRLNIFHLYGLAPMTRVGDIIKEFGARGLGRVRVTFVDATSACIETDVEVAGDVLQAVAGLTLAKLVPYSEYARCKKLGLPLPGLDVQLGGSDDDDEASGGRARKRARREEEEEEEGDEGDKKRACAIM